MSTDEITDNMGSGVTDYNVTNKKLFKENTYINDLSISEFEGEKSAIKLEKNKMYLIAGVLMTKSNEYEPSSFRAGEYKDSKISNYDSYFAIGIKID